VGVGVEIDGVRQWRTYSLTSPAAGWGRFAITVKAIPNGRVSQQLVHRTSPDALLYLRAAQGEFVLPSPVPPRLLFVTAGSGITPVMGMLRTLAAGGEMPDVVLLHSAPTPAETIFGVELRDLAERYPTLRLYQRHTATAGRLTLDELPALCPDWHERKAWACGPDRMLDDAEHHWRTAGVGDRLHVERFRPPAVVAGAGGANRVRFVTTGREVDADAGTPLLTVGEDAGVVMPSGCRMGICFGCVAPLRYGQVRDLRTGQVHGDEGELIQTCVSAAATPIELDL
jgi:ferredoxin-NADP reductase